VPLFRRRRRRGGGSVRLHAQSECPLREDLDVAQLSVTTSMAGQSQEANTDLALMPLSPAPLHDGPRLTTADDGANAA